MGKLLGFMIRDRLVFLRECVRQFRDTGSMFPSSRWVAKELTEPIRSPFINKSDINKSKIVEPNRSPLHILEAGAGTGPVTVEILRLLGPNDKLCICEINPSLMQMLKTRLQKKKEFHLHKDHITFFEGPVQQMSDNLKFDVIICSIPFFNLPIELVQDIFTKFEELSSKSCTLTFFSYLGVRYFAELTPVSELKERARAVSRFFKSLSHLHNVQKKIIWLNFTPIVAYKVEIRGSKLKR